MGSLEEATRTIVREVSTVVGAKRASIMVVDDAAGVLRTVAARLTQSRLYPEAVAFFSELAAKYGDKPNVIYEIVNEPEKDETWPQVKEYATAVISAIRQHDPDNLVIVGSPEWDQRIDLVAQRLPGL